MADCSLITTENLKLLAESDNKPALQSISLLPENFNINDEVKEEALRCGSWQEIGSISQNKNAAFYRSQSFVREIDGRPYRLIVVHSSALDKHKEKSLLKKWSRQREALEKRPRN